MGKLVLRRPRFRPDASYLVTGGTGALGQQLVAWLVGPWRQTPHRSSLASSRRSWHPGADVRVVVADVADAAAMARSWPTSNSPLKGVFHLAGVLDDGVLAAQTPRASSGCSTPSSGVPRSWTA